jgi:hypothetical protein
MSLNQYDCSISLDPKLGLLSKVVTSKSMEYKKSHTGYDSKTMPKSSTLGQDANFLKILNQDAINDFNLKTKC